MTVTDECTHCDALTSTLAEAHEHALAALHTADSRGFDAVAWLSAHLAVMGRLVEPLLDRHGLRTQAQRQEDRRLTHEMQVLLRALEQLTAADALAPRAHGRDVRLRLATILEAHAQKEAAAVRELARVIGPDGADRLAQAYSDAIAHGPTRPHPHAPRRPGLARIAYAIDRRRDRMMDVLDSRRPPFTLRRVPRQRGRWSDYFLGG